MSIQVLFRGVAARLGSCNVSPLTTRRLLMRAPGTASTNAQHFSTEPALQSTRSAFPFRTNTQDPNNHTENDISRFYEIPDEDFMRLFPSGMCDDYMRRRKAFLEATLMVRKPSLDVISILKNDEIYAKPCPKFLFYGEKGSGKTSSLCHVIHWAGRCQDPDWQIIYVPSPLSWAAKPKTDDAIQSAHNEALLDTPKEAIDLLVTYKRINQHLLEKHTPVTASKYVWNMKETFEPGTSFSDLVDFGISRPTYACDVVGALLKEVRNESASWPFRTMLAVDGINAFNQVSRTFKEEPLIFWHMSDFSLVVNVKRALSESWSNGVVVATVDERATYEQTTSYLPRALLGPEGFEELGPCVPMRVGPLEKREMATLIDYGIDRRWIHPKNGGTDEGRAEIAFLSGQNPEQFYEVVKFM